jgi:hypothetical protein
MAHGPKFTASRQDTESFRIDRLHSVWGYAVALADHYGNGDLRKKVAALHDHKGSLTVKWKKKATEGEREFFRRAWESDIGDGSSAVEHEKV